MLLSGVLIKKAETCVDKLIECNKKVTFAESCTGGLLAFLFSSIPNASKVFCGSIVSYMDDAKIRFLNVPEKSINTYGAVSEKVADEMALGALQITAPFGIDIAVSVTGYAGRKASSALRRRDNPLTDEKSTGDVYIGLATRAGRRTVSQHKFSHCLERYEIQERAAEEAINTILAEICRPAY